ncbi:MAG: hypothetical protein LBU11_10720, partial [Zoogloeaceae bacterium]|nr:hypothetical protein [Zoogloeaceae bacterium]
MPSKTRRRLLTRLSTLAALPLLTGFGFARKKPIREFGRIYDYLQDVDLRLKEIGKKRVTIENAEFSGEEFINGYWGYYDFVNCHFPASHNIQLVQTVGCNFTECEFGPSRKDDSIGFGVCRDVLFRRCRFNMANVGFGGSADFEACECVNPDPDPNHRYTLNGGKMFLTRCESTNYSYAADELLVLRDCTMRKGSSKLYSNRKLVADYQLISSTFEDAETILWPSYLKNLTISRCVAKGVFRAQGCVVEDTALYEHLKEGFFDFSGVGYHG